MKRKFLALLFSFFILTLSTVFLGVFSKARATPSWYATFTYQGETYAFSHAFQKTDWNTIIPGFPNSVNLSPDGNAGDKGQTWCNNTLITDGEDNHCDDWFVPNRDELEKSRNYDREKGNPWDPLGRDAKLWSSSTHDQIGRYHRAFANAEESNYTLDKVDVEYARCVRIVSDSSLDVPGFVQLNQDEYFSSSNEKTVLRADINIGEDNTPVLFQSAGRWYCKTGTAGTVSGYLAIDGTSNKSNYLTMTFNSCPLSQHPFLFHSGIKLNKGGHTVELKVKVDSGDIEAAVGASTQITIFTGIKDIQQWRVTPAIINTRYDDWTTVFSTNLLASNLPRIVEYSGSLEAINNTSGDGMVWFFLDGQKVGRFSISDLLQWEDKIVPVNNLYVIPGDNLPHTLELKATRWYVQEVYENQVIFNVLAGGTVIVASGYENLINPIIYQNFQLSPSIPEKVVASTEISIPPGAGPRTILVTGQGTWMGGTNTGNGYTVAWLEMDGKTYGNLSVQNFGTGPSLSNPNYQLGSGSQRTFATAALINNVSPETHTINLKVSQKNSTIPDLIGGGGVTVITAPTPPPITIKELLSNWSTANPEADLNFDGLVNGIDFGRLRKLVD